MPLRAHRYLIPLAAVLAVLPLLFFGPSCGHDFNFHILSWLEAATQYAHGTYPQWAYTPAWNAGEPRFLFYPPISWTLGAVLTLALPISIVPAAYTWVALTLAGFTSHRLASRYASSQAATLAAILYLANPYMLFTAYERTAYAELLAAAFLPLLFQAALASRIRILPIAFPIALLWLTNAPAAVMASYALALLTATRLCLSAWPGKKSRHPERSEGPLYLQLHLNSTKPTPLHLTLTTITGTTLGLLLAAFYILPAAIERKFVQINMAVIPSLRPADHFLFHRMGGTTPDDLFHDTVVRTASLVALTLLALIAAAFWTLQKCTPTTTPEEIGLTDPAKNCHPERSIPQLHREMRSRRTCISASTTLLPLTLLIAFLLTPLSLPLWNHVPELSFLQFPWRLTALLATILLALTAQAFARLPKLPILTPILLAILLIAPSYTLFRQACNAYDTPTAIADLYHSTLGFEGTDEYTPIGADSDSLHPDNPPFWYTCTPPPGDAAINLPPPPNSDGGPIPNHLTLDLPCAASVVVNRRQFPAWHITLNGKPIGPQSPERDDGLITLALPAGHNTLDFTDTRAPDQRLGLLLTALALLSLPFLRKL
jgi:hypothetical protein